MIFSDYRFWIALLAMALITWLMRALPFLWGHRRLKKFSEPDTPLSALGPALLSAICVAVVLPDLLGDGGGDGGNAVAPGFIASLLPYLLGLLVTVLTARTVSNAGGAVLAGVAAYGLFLYIGQQYG